MGDLEQRAHEQRLRLVVGQGVRDSEATLCAMINATPHMVWSADADGNGDYFNDKMLAFTGLTLDALAGDGWAACVHPDDLARACAAWRAALDGATPLSVEFRFRHRSGGYRWVLCRGEPVRDGRGQVTRWMGTNTDIHDQKSANAILRASQEELRVREERYHTLFTAIDEGFVILQMEYDAAGRIVDHRYLEANAAVAAITGRDDLVGKLASAVFPDYSLAWNEMYAQVLRTGETMRFVAEIRNWERWIDFSICKVAESSPDQVAVFLRDITQHKRREEALRNNEERYRALFNAIEEGFAVIEMLFDAGGDPCDFRFIEVNPALGRITGLHDVIGKTLRQLVAQPNLDWVAQYGKVALTGEPAHLTDYSAALDGWFDISVVRVGAAEQHQVALLFSDVTERRRHDEALRTLAEDLARANLRQHEFLATLSHELRNPLAPIRASLELMRMSPAASAKAQEIMRRQVDHLVHLVDDLLDLARITSGKIELKKEPVLLQDVLLGAIEVALPLIQARRHVLSQQIDPEPMWLDADANRLVQVVGNLLTNAAKYTPEGGSITLRAGREQGQARIDVSDNGIGIAPEAQAQVFEMFSQAGAGRALAYGGLGIGLNLVRRLTEKHGGSVQLSSAGVGQGATFTVLLPLREAPPASQLVAAQAGAAAQHRRVLVVDDNVDAADMLGQILRLEGHQVEVAYDAEDALARAARFRPELAVLDIGLPGMNGLQLAQALRGEAGLGGVRLIALTGWGTEEDRRRTSAAGFDAHLTKPVSIDALQAQISALAA